MRFDWNAIPYQQFTFFEKKFAEKFAKDAYQGFFLAYLLKKTIEGELSIKIREGKKIALSLPLEAEFEKKVIEALAIPCWPIVKQGDEYFLHRFYIAYQNCIERLQNFSDFFKVDHKQLEKIIQKYQAENILNTEQLEAVRKGVLSPFFILTGGPGTGKTFTAARLLDTFWQCLAEEKKKNFSIAIVAPTGKAANHLLASLQKGIEDKDLKARLFAKTLHSLLRYNPQKVDEENEPISFDLILVDEASMIDVELMAALCRKLKSNSRLILIGDPFQLPPIEGPGIFPILLNKNFEKVALKTCLRVESQDLLDLSLAVRNGKDLSASSNVKLLDISFQEFIERFHGKFLFLNRGHAALQKFCVLTPTRKGIWGSESLNHHFQEALAKKKMTNIPLLLTANDYTLDLFNGELGLLDQEEVLFSNERKVPFIWIKNYELGFAMTIHKSQGSEFEEVVLILPPSEESYSKELVYTAVTRAKKKLYVIKPFH